MDEKWIQSAIKHKKALTISAKRAGALTSRGTIKLPWLREKAKQGNSTIAHRARLALTLRELK